MDQRWFGLFQQLRDLDLARLAEISAYDGPHGRAFSAVCGEGGPDVEAARSFVGVEPSTVVDLLCGNGRFGLALARDGHGVTCVDESRTLLDIAEERNRGANPVSIVHADVLDLTSRREVSVDVAAGSVDWVVIGGASINVLPSSALRGELLLFARSLLTDGGRVFLDFFTPQMEEDRGYSLFPPMTGEDGFTMVGHEVSADRVVMNLYSELEQDDGMVLRFMSSEVSFPLTPATVGQEIAAAGLTVLDHGSLETHREYVVAGLSVTSRTE